MKHPVTFTRYALLVFVMFGSAVLISSCDEEGGPSVYNGTLLELIHEEKYQQAGGASASQALDSLARYITTFPELESMLDGSAEITLFAPSNSAFITLLETLGFANSVSEISPSFLVAVFSYQIVQGNLKQEDLLAAVTGTGITSGYTYIHPCTSAQTPQVIKVNEDGSLLTGSTNNAITIVVGDKSAQNGTLHITDAVLIPPAIGERLNPALGKLSATVQVGADYTWLARAMAKADCGTPSLTSISTMLSQTGPYTVFLAHNDCFQFLADQFGSRVEQYIAGFTPAQWRNIILNHISAGSFNNATLSNGEQLTTMLNANAKLTVSIGQAGTAPGQSPIGKYLTTSGGTTSLGGATNAPIMATDIEHSNGVAHVVGRILNPN